MQPRPNAGAGVALQVARGRGEEQNERQVVYDAEVEQDDLGLGPQLAVDQVDQDDHREAQDRDADAHVDEQRQVVLLGLRQPVARVRVVGVGIGQDGKRGEVIALTHHQRPVLERAQVLAPY